MKTALRLLNDLVKIIYADEYDKIEIPMLRNALFSVENHFNDIGDKSMQEVFKSAENRLNNREEADRLKPEELTELMLSKLTVTELNELLSGVVEAGSVETNKKVKERHRATYKKILKELKGRTQ